MDKKYERIVLLQKLRIYGPFLPELGLQRKLPFFLFRGVTSNKIAEPKDSNKKDMSKIEGNGYNLLFMDDLIIYRRHSKNCGVLVWF